MKKPGNRGRVAMRSLFADGPVVYRPNADAEKMARAGMKVLTWGGMLTRLVIHVMDVVKEYPERSAAWDRLRELAAALASMRFDLVPARAQAARDAMRAATFNDVLDPWVARAAEEATRLFLLPEPVAKKDPVSHDTLKEHECSALLGWLNP